MDYSEIINNAAMRTERTNCMIRCSDVLEGIHSGKYTIECSNPLILFEKCTGYRRLYYFLSDNDRSFKLDINVGEPVYGDISVKGDFSYSGSVFEQASLVPYRTYMRMRVFGGGNVYERPYEPVLAEAGDSEKIYAMIYSMFDPMADTLPDAKELNQLISKGNVLKIDIKDNIVGFLFFEDTGVRSYLRTLAVDRDYRGKSIGFSLMSRYFEIHSLNVAKQFTLWTDINNSAAISLYSKFGYTPDGVKNYIFKTV